MHFTKVQISELMRKHAEKENGLQDLMEIMLESMMVAERGEFLRESPGNKGNGYRPGHTYGQGRKLEFRIPRDRYGNFHPWIWHYKIFCVNVKYGIQVRVSYFFIL